jgi:tRNA(adenine34) deaminase
LRIKAKLREKAIYTETNVVLLKRNILIIPTRSHEYFMKEALKEALYAFEEDEVPIGAVVVAKNRIIAKGHNQVEKLKDPTAHAEMIALTAATNALNSKYLEDCTIYITVEPCLMCATALFWSKIPQIVFGASDNRYGFTNFAANTLFPASIEIVSAIEKETCSQLMKDFFKQKRK